MFGLGTAISIALVSLAFVFSTVNYIALSVYTAIFVMVFVTVIVLYVLIVVKLVQNGKKLGRVAQKPPTG